MAKKKIKAPDLDAEFRSNFLASASFLIDGFKVSITHEFAKNKLYKMIYVNGMQKGEWYVNKESEETKRFAYSTWKYLHSKSFRDDILKLYKGVRKKEKRKELERKIESVTFFTGVKVNTIIKQWCDREINKSIVLVDNKGNELFKYK